MVPTHSVSERATSTGAIQSIDVLLLESKQAKEANDVNALLPQLLTALPHFSRQQFRTWQENCLSNLIKNATATQQQELAIGMGQWYLKQSSKHGILSAYLEAMHFFGKAIQIAEQHNLPIKPVHQLATIPMMRLVNQYLVEKDTFAKRLDHARRSRRDDHKAFVVFTRHINQIDHIRCFCGRCEDFTLIEILYKSAAHVLTLVPTELEEKYRSCSAKVLSGLKIPYT